jgi:hypothetical protein
VIGDSGPGIEDAQQLKVFEPFHTTKRGGGHLGTGLSAAQQVAADHGGFIEIEPPHHPRLPRARAAAPRLKTMSDSSPSRLAARPLRDPAARVAGACALARFPAPACARCCARSKSAAI